MKKLEKRESKLTLKHASKEMPSITNEIGRIALYKQGDLVRDEDLELMKMYEEETGTVKIKNGEVTICKFFHFLNAIYA